MGLILDTSILVAGERRGETVKKVIQRVQAAFGDAEAALSAVSIVEITHGIYRARRESDRERRMSFCKELCRDMIIHPVSLEIAWLAGKIEGEQAAKGYCDRLRGSHDWSDGLAFQVRCGDAERQAFQTHSQPQNSHALALSWFRLLRRRNLPFTRPSCSIIYQWDCSSKPRSGTTPEACETSPLATCVRSSPRTISQLQKFSRRPAMWFT